MARDAVEAVRRGVVYVWRARTSRLRAGKEEGQDMLRNVSRMRSKPDTHTRVALRVTDRAPVDLAVCGRRRGLGDVSVPVFIVCLVDDMYLTSSYDDITIVGIAIGALGIASALQAEGYGSCDQKPAELGDRLSSALVQPHFLGG